MEEYKSELQPQTDGIRAAIDAGVEIGASEAFEIQGIPHLLVPKTMDLHNMKSLMEAPQRVQVTRIFHEPKSFIEYVDEYANDDTRIYGDDQKHDMIAVIDDHEAIHSVEAGPALVNPRWCDHVAHLELQLSGEWTAWASKNKQNLSHLDFVEHLQDRISTIAKPDASVILDAARHFSAHRNAKFDNVIPVEGGDLEASYSEEVRGVVKDGRATLPSRITLSLRPYRCRADRVVVEVTVRWRLSREGQLTFSFTMLRLEEILEGSYASVRAEVEEETGRKVLL